MITPKSFRQYGCTSTHLRREQSPAASPLRQLGVHNRRLVWQPRGWPRRSIPPRLSYSPNGTSLGFNGGSRDSPRTWAVTAPYFGILFALNPTLVAVICLTDMLPGTRRSAKHAADLGAPTRSISRFLLTTASDGHYLALICHSRPDVWNPSIGAFVFNQSSLRAPIQSTPTATSTPRRRQVTTNKQFLVYSLHSKNGVRRRLHSTPHHTTETPLSLHPMLLLPPLATATPTATHTCTTPPNGTGSIWPISYCSNPLSGPM